MWLTPNKTLFTAVGTEVSRSGSGHSEHTMHACVSKAAAETTPTSNGPPNLETRDIAAGRLQSQLECLHMALTTSHNGEIGHLSALL